MRALVGCAVIAYAGTLLASFDSLALAPFDSLALAQGGQPTFRAGTEIVSSVGMFLIAEFRTTRGYFCRRCLPVLFVKATAMNFTVGLLWALGLFSAPLLTLMNLFPLVFSFGIARGEAGASSPEIDDAILARIRNLVPRLSGDIERETGDFHESAAKLAPEAGLRPAQVIHALRLMGEAALPPPGGRGFEVILEHQPVLAEQRDRPPISVT